MRFFCRLMLVFHENEMVPLLMSHDNACTREKKRKKNNNQDTKYFKVCTDQKARISESDAERATIQLTSVPFCSANTLSRPEHTE